MTISVLIIICTSPDFMRKAATFQRSRQTNNLTIIYLMFHYKLGCAQERKKCKMKYCYLLQLFLRSVVLPQEQPEVFHNLICIKVIILSLDWNPEKDCGLWLMFQQPARKLSSESSDTEVVKTSVTNNSPSQDSNQGMLLLSSNHFLNNIKGWQLHISWDCILLVGILFLLIFTFNPLHEEKSKQQAVLSIPISIIFTNRPKYYKYIRNPTKFCHRCFWIRAAKMISCLAFNQVHYIFYTLMLMVYKLHKK